MLPAQIDRAAVLIKLKGLGVRQVLLQLQTTCAYSSARDLHYIFKLHFSNLSHRYRSRSHAMHGQLELTAAGSLDGNALDRQQCVKKNYQIVVLLIALL